MFPGTVLCKHVCGVCKGWGSEGVVHVCTCGWLLCVLVCKILCDVQLCWALIGEALYV